jgi:hypothetical protein
MFQDGPGFQNHWAFEECPIEEAGRRKDQRKDETTDGERSAACRTDLRGSQATEGAAGSPAIANSENYQQLDLLQAATAVRKKTQGDGYEGASPI